MRRIGLVVTDLDGTILRPDGSFSDATRRAFQHLRAAGIPAAFATARFHTRELARELGVPYMIRTDGTLISDAAGRVLHRRFFSADGTDRILKAILSENPEADIAIPTLDGVYRECRPPFGKEALKIVATLGDEKDAAQIADTFGCRAIRYRGEDRYSFLPAGAGKAEAVKALADLLEVPLSQVAAFGDDIGDIGMLKACGIGVAVADAPDAVKAAADFVCGACLEDGVAKWIEKAHPCGIIEEIKAPNRRKNR